MKVSKSLLCVIALALPAASVQSQGVIGNAPPFKPAVMAAQIDATMKPQVVGYAYSIAQNGQIVKEGGDGSARIALDGYRKHGPNMRQNIASVSKTFTAVAIMQLIEANKSKGVTPDSKIGPYLPDGWKPGANVADLTFADVMRHRTGLSSGNLNGFSLLGFEGVKKTVEGGTSPRPAPDKERPYAYDNVNYALLRELMLKLWDQSGGVTMVKPADLKGFTTYGDYTSAMYTQYMTNKVFTPLDIKYVLCKDFSDDGTLYYPLNPTVKGVVGPDQSKFCGSGGLYLSTHELTKFFVYFFNTEVLLPEEARQTMIDRRFGLDGNNTSKGISLSRNGNVGVGSNSQGKAGVKACMMHFPGGIDAALVQNSPDNASLNDCSVLIAAYDAAWK